MGRGNRFPNGLEDDLGHFDRPFGRDKFVAATANGLLLREATVYSFDSGNPSQLHPLYNHPAAVWCVDSTSDGGKVASVDYRGNLVIYDSVTGETQVHEKAFERWCQSMMIAPSGTSIVAGNEAGKVLIWDLFSGKVIKTAELGGHAVTGLAISPDQSTLAATDGSGQVHLLKWPTLEPAGKIKISDQTAWCVAFVDDGKSLLVGSSDRNLYKCDAVDGATPKSVTKGTDWITQLAVSPSGQVAAGEVGGRLHFPSTGGSDSMEAASGVWSLCWNADSQLYAGTRKDGIVVAGRSWKWTATEPPAAEPPAAEPPTAEPEPAPAENTEEMPEEKPEVKAEPKPEDKPRAEARQTSPSRRRQKNRQRKNSRQASRTTMNDLGVADSASVSKSNPADYVVRCGSMRTLGVMTSTQTFRYGEEVVVRTNRGTEIGIVLCEATPIATNYMDEPIDGKILRLATEEDRQQSHRFRELSSADLQVCQRCVDALALKMELVDVETDSGWRENRHLLPCRCTS